MINTKKSKLLIIILSVSLLFAACAKSSDSANTATDTNNTNESQSDNGTGRIRPDVYGQVKSILGNEIALALAEVPVGNGRADMTEEERKKFREQMQSLSPEERQKKMQESIKFTGETMNIIIPVGTPITSFKQGEESQLDLADIYEGTMLQIWFYKDEGETKTVKSVRVMQGR